jgi:hypothetical protein
MPDLLTSIRLDSKLKSELLKRSKAQGCSMKWLIADILAKWLAWIREQEGKK